MSLHVTKSGVVTNHKVKVITKSLNKNGYHSVWCGISKKRLYVHRLVAMNYLPNSDNLTDVNHIDGDKTNNHVSNLEWINRSGNVQHMYDVLSKGNKLTKEQIAIINNNPELSSRKCAALAGCNQKTVLNYRNSQ